MQYVLNSQFDIPFSIAYMKGYLNITSDAFDGFIEELYAAAFTYAEDYTGLAFRQQNWKLKMSAPEAALGTTIAKNPITTINSVKYKLKGIYHNLSSDQYHISVSDSSAFFFVTDQTVFTVCDTGIDSIEFDFTINYGGIPNGISQAVDMLVAFWFENRGDASPINNDKIPPQVKVLLDQKRVLFL